MHIEFLLEEPSAEAFLREIAIKLVPPNTTWNFVVFQGKPDLLINLGPRLRAYRKWIPDDYRLVVLIDEDRQDCIALKAQMEAAATSAGLATKTSPTSGQFLVLNRIAVEELEAWFFGDVGALCDAYPGVPRTLASKVPYRNPDSIAGGTWEALERVLQKAGYYKSGLPKIEVAREIARHMDPSQNRSTSFGHFVLGISAL